MIYRGPCFLTRLYDLAPPPPPLSRQQVVSFSQPSCESPGEGRGGGGAKSHDRTKVWSSTKHSILLDSLPLLVQFSNPVRLLGRFHCKKLALYTFRNRSLENKFCFKNLLKADLPCNRFTLCMGAIIEQK
jgi:hypothetical protein